VILPRLIIGAASSGAGKTSLMVGLLEALGRRGIDVRPFKTGPDYLDPALHRAVRGLSSRNLDPRLMGKAAVRACLCRAGGGGELALIEGVMGYYDGSPASTADLARLIGSPAVLAIDASGAAESAAAVALGFLRFRRNSGIQAFIVNRVGSPVHYRMVKEAIERRTGLPVVGFLPADPALALPERHLGLVAPAENPDFLRAVAALGDAVAENIDLDALLAIARGAPDFAAPEGSAATLAAGSVSRPTRRRKKARIAVALDGAFSFYYEDNLDALRDLGAELVFFSPLADRVLPSGTSAVYIGGGYPELHGPRLAANRSMREAMRRAAAEGLPIWAECGGWMWLLDSFDGPDGTSYSGCGLLRGHARIGTRLAALGYRIGRTLAPSILGPSGTKLGGHVFHYASIEGGEAGKPALSFTRPGVDSWNEGAIDGSVFASWLHIHAAANRPVLRAFVEAARRARAASP